MSMQKHSTTFGSQTIDYLLTYADRKTLGITVHPDLKITVKAPDSAVFEEIEKRIQKKSPWIIKQLDYFESFLPRTPERKYVSGETHRYLGKQYRLKVIESEDEQVKMKAGYIQVFLPYKFPQEVKRLLTKWYYNHAKNKLTERYEQAKTKFKKYDIEPESLRFMRMKTRWGSCSKRHSIVLNPELIKAPLRCIDYVIIHEMCHIRHHDHGKDFYQLLDIMMPDWKRWKDKLEKVMA